MTSKQRIVDAAHRHPLYQAVADHFGDGVLPTWNFAKYLIGRDGAVKGIFPEHMSPQDPQIVTAIVRELAAPAH